MPNCYSTMSFLKNIFKDDDFLFSDLKPADRIYKVIETCIYPDLEKIGFKLNKSATLSRKVGDFKQEIYFAKNKYNQGNEVVSFDPHFNVTSTTYVKWHKKTYGTEPMNEYVLGSSAHYVPNWSHEYFKDWWYDLAKDKNLDIVNALKNNINKAGLPYLNALADKQGAIDYILEQNSYYYKAPMLFDFAFMLNDKKQAEKILHWFNNYKNSTGTIFQADTLKAVKLRQEVLNNWA
jgi:hypothetical protein